MEQRIVRTLEAEIEQAVADVINRLDRRSLPLLPSHQTMHLMAKAAVTVYETAVENTKAGRRVMKILFLHGWTSVPGGRKPTFLKEHGHDVLNPALPDEDFDESVRIAEAEYRRHEPDVIVGSSRGGGVAVNMASGDTPLVLLCPAWKKWGTATTIKPNTIILHSRHDDVIPLGDSEDLVANSGLPPETLVEIGNDHRLADPEPLRAMLQACTRLVHGTR